MAVWVWVCGCACGCEGELLPTSRRDLSSTGTISFGAVWSKILAQYMLKGRRVPQTRKEISTVAATSAIYKSLKEEVNEKVSSTSMHPTGS